MFDVEFINYSDNDGFFKNKYEAKLSVVVDDRCNSLFSSNAAYLDAQELCRKTADSVTLNKLSNRLTKLMQRPNDMDMDEFKAVIQAIEEFDNDHADPDEVGSMMLDILLFMRLIVQMKDVEILNKNLAKIHSIAFTEYGYGYDDSEGISSDNLSDPDMDDDGEVDEHQIKIGDDTDNFLSDETDDELHG